MDVTVYKKTYAQITLENEKDIETLVMILEFARAAETSSLVELAERMLEAFCEVGY